MKINKRCLSAFSKTKPLLALGTKSKLFDTTFSLTSELSLYDYSLDIHHPTLQLDRKFSKIIWCEKGQKSVLATGHDNGMVSLYEPCEASSFRLLNSFEGMDGDVLGLDFNVCKNVLAAGSANGKIIFWNLDKIDQQYKCDIPINANITTLSWNRKVSRILAAGTDDGRILVLDIRAKNIAMTLETPDLKPVTRVAWHPKCPTSIFASTSLNLTSFNLSTDSMNTIDSSIIGFDFLGDTTLVSHSKNRINYMDLETQKIREYEEVEGLFEASFSSLAPLACISSSNGTTVVTGRRDSSILKNSHLLFKDFILSSSSPRKIVFLKMSREIVEDLNHKVLKKIYKDGEFNLTEENRKEVGNLIFESQADCKEEEFLVKHDFESIPLGSKSVDLRFILDLLLHKKTRDEGNSSLSITELLLSLLASGNYKTVVDSLPPSQWKVMICILLFSDFPLSKCLETFKKLEKHVPEKDKGLIHLLTNNPEDFSVETDLTPPKSVYEVTDFFSEYLPVVEKIKALRIKTDSKFLEEFSFYARDRGLYDLVKDLPKKEEKYKENDVSKKMSHPPILPLQSNASLPKQLYPSSQNRSATSLEHTEIPRVGPSINQPALSSPLPRGPPIANRISTPSLGPKVVPPQSQRIAPPPSVGQRVVPPTPTPQSQRIVSPTPQSQRIVSPTLQSQRAVPPQPVGQRSVPPSSSGFSTRPPLYSSPSSSESTPSFKPRQDNVPGTYGSEHLRVASPKTPPMPGFRGSFVPKPGHAPKDPSTSSTIQNEVNYDVDCLTKELEKVFEKLKEEASKKNNLIIGNKIKDASRRFSVFQNLDKQALTKNVLYRISLVVQTFKDVAERDILKQSIKAIVEESIDLQENQCNIWIPAIYTLVQLVY